VGRVGSGPPPSGLLGAPVHPPGRAPRCCCGLAGWGNAAPTKGHPAAFPFSRSATVGCPARRSFQHPASPLLLTADGRRRRFGVTAPPRPPSVPRRKRYRSACRYEDIANHRPA